MDSFFKFSYPSLEASRTFFRRILAYMNFTLDSKDISVGKNKKSDFYELWQQHRQLRRMEMSEALHDIYDEGYLH